MYASQKQATKATLMRFDTYNASQYLVRRLLEAQAIRDLRDEGDILLLDLEAGGQLMVCIVERGMSLSEVKYHYETNTQRGIYTLMLLWVDMFIPRDGTTTDLNDWMQVLDHLHGGKLYGYEVAGQTAFFFPVYLQGTGYQRRVRFGNIVDYTAIGGRQRHINTPLMAGEWLVGGFDFATEGYKQHAPAPASALSQHYAVLGLSNDADLDSIKRAYRTLARLYHPDVNQDGASDERMKRINAAYQAILRDAH